jgi:hypothetical protein
MVAGDRITIAHAKRLHIRGEHVLVSREVEVEWAKIMELQ